LVAVGGQLEIVQLAGALVGVAFQADAVAAAGLYGLQ
jgi:hypothetical protein